MSAVFAIVFLAALVGLVKPYINGLKRWHFGLGAFLAFIMIGIVSEGPVGGDVGAEEVAMANSGSGSDVEATTDAVQDQPKSSWQYYNDRDEMRGTETRFAQLDGSNTINLDFPYGEQRGVMLVRQSPQYGFDILVGVPSGQILCNSYSRSYINVKFDEGSIERYGCIDASDGTSNMVFVEGAQGFLTKLKRSDRVIVEAEFFQNGTQQMTFETANLEWES